MRNLLAMSALAIALTGCALPIRSVDRQVRPTTSPAIGTTNTAGVGEVVLESKHNEFVKGRIVDGPMRATIGIFPFEFDGMYARTNDGQNYCGISINRDPLNYGKRNFVCYTDDEFLNLKIPFRDGEIPAEGRPTLRQIVEYGGKSGSSISLHYKEFSDSTTGSLARPAFTQEFRFELSDGSTIGLKGSRLEIIEANNTGLKYKVLTPLQ